MYVISMIIALFVLVLLSAFFSSSETAFLCIPKIRLRQMQKEKKRNARLIAELKNKTDTLLTVILIGNNFVNALAASLATALAIELLGENGTGVATMVMTVVIIMFGEILPKTIATYKSEQIAGFVAPILNLLKKIMHPIVFVFAKFTAFVKRITSKKGDESSQITEEELKTLFDLGGQEGILEVNEKDMLHKIFEFGDLRAHDIEKSRTLVKMIEANVSFEETVQIFSESGFSRLPVYEDNAENIIGLLHFKDVLFYSETKTTYSPKKLAKDALFIPETKDAIGILQTFKTEKQNFAVVIDEHGSFSGIITMDDLVRAVFGRATDSYDKGTLPFEDRITIITPTEFIVPGDVELDDVNNAFKLELNSIDSDTMGGWLLETFDYLPDTGESIKHENILYTVEKQSNRRIQQIRIKMML